MGDDEQSRRDSKRAALMSAHPQAGPQQDQSRQAQQREEQRMAQVPMRQVVQQTVAPTGTKEARTATEAERIAGATVGVYGSNVVANIRRFHPESMPMLRDMELYRMF